MKTIAFYNNKGGVGKTTLAANVGYNLSAMGYRVLMVDCDPQGNLSSFFGRYDLTRKGLMQALEGQQRCIYRTNYHGLDILPGNIYSESLTPQPETMETVLQQYSKKYDWCILDCAPAFSRLTESAVQASDEVIIPTFQSKESTQQCQNWQIRQQRTLSLTLFQRQRQLRIS